MRNQLSNGRGILPPGRTTSHNPTTTGTLSSEGGYIGLENGQTGKSNQIVKTNSNVENGVKFSACGESLSNLDFSRAGKFGNRGEVLPKMPPKLQPNFGDDPSRRVRKWNNAVERKFELNMVAMSQELKSRTSRLDKGIRSMEEQLKDLDLERSYNTTSSLDSSREDDTDSRGLFLKFPAIPSSRRHSNRRQGSGHKCSYSSSGKKRKCRHFPCVRPPTYHTIGYRGNPDFTPWMSWEDIKESWNAPELVDNVSTSAHDVKVTPRLLTLRREEKLRKEIGRRKLQNDMRRPQSWVTNYGQPMSYKQLKYPVRLNPLTN